ncbi:MAG: agmatinase [Candidatus Thermoplasmatota archaeon]|nr:agmatinase [Candidatus Thermoplasmatota archaeon]
MVSSFAEADKSFEEAKYVIFGVPFDRTASYRPGARFAPMEIRKASYNFETYMFEHDVDLLDVPAHDMGDTDDFGSTEDMAMEVLDISDRIAGAKKFPIAIGGEHGISPPVLEALAGHYPGELGVLIIDAHLDFRAEYMGDRNNHACAARRFSESVGVDRVFPIGVRSICREEMDDAKKMGLRWMSARKAMAMKPADALAEAVSSMKAQNLYLSIDIDGIDPAFAPGTGTPEPFGLGDCWVRDLIQAAAPRLVGMDLVEVCPPADQGNTAALGARLIREALAATWKAGAGKP